MTKTRLLFAYGAMMAPSVVAKRGVTPVREPFPARLRSDDLALAFSHRAAYATLTSRGDDASGLCRRRPFGVIIELDASDFAKVAEREVGYRIAEVVVERLGVDGDHDARCVSAEAFVSTWGMELIDGPLPPTARYRGLILDGLERYGIRAYEAEGGAAYVEWVRSLPTVEDGGIARDPAYSKTGVELATRVGFGVAALAAAAAAAAGGSIR